MRIFPEEAYQPFLDSKSKNKTDCPNEDEDDENPILKGLNEMKNSNISNIDNSTNFETTNKKISNILDKSLCIMNYNIYEKDIIKKIIICENNETIDFDEIKKIYEICIKNKNQTIYINYIKLYKILELIEKRIKNELINKCNFTITLKFENKGDQSIYNITCEYLLVDPLTGHNKIFQDENILEKKINSYKGLSSLIYELNNKKYRDNLILKLENINLNINNIHIIQNTNNLFYYYTNKDKENNKEDNNILIIYDEKLNEIKKINIENDSINNIKANSYNNEDSIMDLIAVGIQNLYLIQIDLNNLKNEIPIKRIFIPDKNIFNCIHIQKDNYILVGQGRASYCHGLLNSEKPKEEKISDYTYINGIKINQNIIALTSNSEFLGSNEIKFYDIRTKKFIKGIHENFSISNSANGLALMPREKTESINKVLICNCKKKYNSQDNGILLLVLQFKEDDDNSDDSSDDEDNEELERKFFNTYNFEPECICPILKIYSNYKMAPKIEDTKYFLVGGHYTDKKEGAIKLFKVNYSNVISNVKIEFIQNIEFDSDFAMNPLLSIESIFQSKLTGKIGIITGYGDLLYIDSFQLLNKIT